MSSPIALLSHNLVTFETAIQCSDELLLNIFSCIHELNDFLALRLTCRDFKRCVDDRKIIPFFNLAWGHRIVKKLKEKDSQSLPYIQALMQLTEFQLVKGQIDLNLNNFDYVNTESKEITKVIAKTQLNIYKKRIVSHRPLTAEEINYAIYHLEGGEPENMENRVHQLIKMSTLARVHNNISLEQGLDHLSTVSSKGAPPIKEKMCLAKNIAEIKDKITQRKFEEALKLTFRLSGKSEEEKEKLIKKIAIKQVELNLFKEAFATVSFLKESNQPMVWSRIAIGEAKLFIFNASLALNNLIEYVEKILKAKELGKRKLETIEEVPEKELEEDDCSLFAKTFFEIGCLALKVNFQLAEAFLSHAKRLTQFLPMGFNRVKLLCNIARLEPKNSAEETLNEEKNKVFSYFQRQGYKEKLIGPIARVEKKLQLTKQLAVTEEKFKKVHQLQQSHDKRCYAQIELARIHLLANHIEEGKEQLFNVLKFFKDNPSCSNVANVHCFLIKTLYEFDLKSEARQFLMYSIGSDKAILKKVVAIQRKYDAETCLSTLQHLALKERVSLIKGFDYRENSNGQVLINRKMISLLETSPEKLEILLKWIQP